MGTEIELLPNRAEREAAWALYVELTTRVAIQPFNPHTGLMRDVLSSLYSLFDLTRKILREAGPSVAYGSNSLGALAITILTVGLAPFTTKWHELLKRYEMQRAADVSALDHEHAWERFEEMCQELEMLQQEMRHYVEALARIAGIN